MKFIPSGEPSGSVRDVKPYVRYHPRIGYEYIPGVEFHLPQPGGGTYTLRVNQAGIRSDREYSPTKPTGVRRLLVFGDSFAAGQYVSNTQRFSELLERRIPNFEAINFGLEGSGTDQQLLLYEQAVSRYEHDMVLLMPFLQNIRRNLADAREAIDPASGTRVFVSKPRFELINNELVLRNVPVPEERKAVAEAGELKSDLPGLRGRIKGFLNRFGLVRSAKKILYRVKPWEPFSEYTRADTPAWQLMSAIIRRFRSVAGSRPLFIAPVFYASYVRYRMATNYLDRFRELTNSLPNTQLIDMLPNFQSLGVIEGVRCFFDPHDTHYSPQGHLLIADLLAKIFTEQCRP